MKDPYQVLEQKKMETERVRREIEALSLIAEDADWVGQTPDYIGGLKFVLPDWI